MPGTIYALANQKGGVGKTTTAVNLAACLAEAGERVLVVDLDPQANATSGLGERANGVSSADLLDGAPLVTLTRATRFPKLDLVPAKADLAGTAADLARRDNAEHYLAEALKDATHRYAFVFVDCPPALGPLTVNALAAADRVLVPVQAEYYALEGLSQLLNTVHLVQQGVNPSLGIDGVLLTMYDARLNLSRQVAADAREYFGAKVFQSVIPRNVRLAEAPSFGKPIILYDLASVGAQAYMGVAKELLERKS
jgi:chromosome partitioning protein